MDNYGIVQIAPQQDLDKNRRISDKNLWFLDNFLIVQVSRNKILDNFWVVQISRDKIFSKIFNKIFQCFLQQDPQQNFQQDLDKFAAKNVPAWAACSKFETSRNNGYNKFATRLRQLENCLEQVRGKFAASFQQYFEILATRKKTSLQQNCGEILILSLWQAKPS